MDEESPNELRTVRPVISVRLEENSKLCGPLIEIPTEVDVQVVGRSVKPGMLEVLWDGEKYAVFEVDLLQRTVTRAECPNDGAG